MSKKTVIKTNFAGLDMSRIAIIGCPGSGKTTFSNTLGQILKREVIHLDKVLWKENWVMPDYYERSQIHGGIISADNWIIDGMWKSHLADRLNRATLVIFLDYKRSICVYRALKRRIKYTGKQRDDIADGCIEKLDGYFIKYIWTFRKKSRPQILQTLKEHSSLDIITLSSPRDTESFVLELNNFVKGQ